MTAYAFLLLLAAAGLDIIANMLLQKSDGMRKLKFGIPAILMVCLAFTLLAWSTEFLPLTVAYVSWGALAVLGTVICGRIFLGQRLNWRGWLGIIMILTSIVVLNAV